MMGGIVSHAALVRNFRESVARRVVRGSFSKSTNPAFVEIMGFAAFDFAVLDLEHAPHTVLSLQNLMGSFHRKMQRCRSESLMKKCQVLANNEVLEGGVL